MGCGASSAKGPRGKYTNGKILGSGMSCDVREVQDKKTGAKYAIKELKKKSGGNILVGQEELWESEVTVLELVKGPNILELVDSFQDDKMFYVLTTLCSGGELFDRISAICETVGHFTEKLAADFAKQMITAIQFCHSKNVVHRDIKPENFVFATADTDSPLTLIDFGCALEVKDNEDVHDTIGSLYYFAPEVLFDNNQLNKYGITRNGACWKKSDMWSIGVIVYLLVCGEPPFNEPDSEAKTHELIKSGKFTFPADVKLSKPCKAFIKSLLTLNPAKRPTATKALKHPWLTKPNVASDMPLPMKVLQGLSTFQNAYRLKHAVGKVMLERLAGAEKRALLTVFDQFDVDNDGILGIEEIGKMMTHIGRGEEKDVARLMDLMDDDESGTITKEEFVAAAMASQLSAASEEKLRNTFDIFDEDGDGNVDQKEIRKMFPDLKQERITEMIKEADTDGDGKISFKEWLVVMKA